LHPETEEELAASPKSSRPPSKKAKNVHEFREATSQGIVPAAQSSRHSLIDELLSDIKGDTSLSLILRGLAKSVKAKNIKDWLSPIRLKGVKIVRDDSEAAAFVSFFQLSDAKKALRHNGQFLGGFKVILL
uniref:RRM domain-containing protein n=1 Tax=Gongylonema pulchrum TaxID=637853 RepID=A0A183EMI5_9BILA